MPEGFSVKTLALQVEVPSLHLGTPHITFVQTNYFGSERSEAYLQLNSKIFHRQATDIHADPFNIEFRVDNDFIKRVQTEGERLSLRSAQADLAALKENPWRNCGNFDKPQEGIGFQEAQIRNEFMGGGVKLSSRGKLSIRYEYALRVAAASAQYAVVGKEVRKQFNSDGIKMTSTGRLPLKYECKARAKAVIAGAKEILKLIF